jgi:hypothetical protein
MDEAMDEALDDTVKCLKFQIMAQDVVTVAD